MPAEATLDAAPAAAQAAAPAAEPSPNAGRDLGHNAPAEVSITPPVVDKGPQAPPPRKGSARDRLFQELRKKSGIEAEPDTPPVTAPKEASKTSDEPVPPEAQVPKEAAEATATDKKGKVNPWKLVDEHKAARAKAEQEIAELRKKIPDEAKTKAEQERIQAIEKRAQELEEEIRFTNYSKSKEFQEKYQKPYEDAWKRWMTELGELTVSDPATGSERALNPQDLLALVNLPLQKARELAESQFGSFADDVMSARKEIRGLFEQQSQALEDARKGGAEREKQLQQQQQQFHEQTRKEISELWDRFNKEVVADEKIGRFFKPVEGDNEGNQRLAKGYEMADRAFQVSPLDPSLTPEQRAEVVRLHTAIRNRAAAFGRVSWQNQQLEAKLKAALDELAKFKSAQPGAGEGVREKPNGPVSARDSVFSALHKLAH